MNSEKVKEIKKALECWQESVMLSTDENYVSHKVYNREILDYINELESENDTLHTNLCEYRRENKELKEIALNQSIVDKKVGEMVLENQELKDENEMLQGVLDIANEREHRKKFNDEWLKEYQKELDKQGNGHIAGFPDFDLVYKLYFEQKDRIAELEKEKKEHGKKKFLRGWKLGIEEFAARLKEKGQKAFINIGGLTASAKTVTLHDIDETLKEFIND